MVDKGVAGGVGAWKNTKRLEDKCNHCNYCHQVTRFGQGKLALQPHSSVTILSSSLMMPSGLIYPRRSIRPKWLVFYNATGFLKTNNTDISNSQLKPDVIFNTYQLKTHVVLI